MNKGSVFSKIVKIRDDYDEFKEDKNFHNIGNDASHNSQMDSYEKTFYNSYGKQHDQGSSSENSQNKISLSWENEFVYQPVNNQSWTDEFEQNKELWVNEFENGHQLWINEFNEKYSKNTNVKDSPHDEEFEREIIETARNDYYKVVDWEGNMTYEMPHKYNITCLEHFANDPNDMSKYNEKERFKIDELINNYKHIRNKLFGNDLPIKDQNFDDLHKVFVGGILCGVSHEKHADFRYIENVKRYFEDKIKDYINDLTLLVTLENTNVKMMNRLNDFDLELIKDLNVQPSSVLKRIKSTYYTLDNILSYRYHYLHMKYNNVVDMHESKNNEKSFKSSFEIRNIHSYYDPLYDILSVKHVIDPFTGEKYVSFKIEYDDILTELIPYNEGLNFDKVLYPDEKRYPHHTNITKILSKLKFKDIPDELNSVELSKFVHMNNLRKLDKMKKKLDKEDNDIINTYPNNTCVMYNEDSTYNINYKPLVYIALKYNPDFLTTYHENLESDAVETIEKYLENESMFYSVEVLRSELDKSIENKNVNEALKIATYMHNNEIPYIKNKKLLMDLGDYIDDVKRDRRWKDGEQYKQLMKIIYSLDSVKSKI